MSNLSAAVSNFKKVHAVGGQVDPAMIRLLEEAEGNKSTDYDTQFLNNVGPKLRRGMTISDKQIEVLTNIALGKTGDWAMRREKYLYGIDSGFDQLEDDEMSPGDNSEGGF